MVASGSKTTKQQQPRKVKAAPPRQPGQPWTVPELARELRVSDQYLYDRIKAGKVKVLQLDGVNRIADSVAQNLIGTAA
jgi:hypothetical protein